MSITRGVCLLPKLAREEEHTQPSAPPTVGPSASWVLRLPTWLDTGTLYFQGVHFDATNSQIFTTQRLNVPIVK